MVLSSYIEVVLPLPLQGTFTYSLPEAMREQVSVGARVIVPFGHKKFYTGIVTGFSPVEPKEYQVKEILHVLDPRPMLRHPQLRFWDWIAEYYLCSVGDVFRAAVPAGMKIESETRFEANPDYDLDEMAMLSEREAMAAQLLQAKGKLSAKDIEKETGFANVPALMQRLVDKGAVIVSETLVDKYRPKKGKYVRVAFERHSEEAMSAAFAAVRNAKKQEAMLLTLLQISNFNAHGRPVAEVEQKALLDASKGTDATLKALVDKGIVERYTREVSRFDAVAPGSGCLPELTEAQQAALKGVHDSFKEKAITLLHGVSASGKTEIYAHLIDYVLGQGNQALYLVPEIALTVQLTSRLRAIFGDKVVIYHSKFTDNERVEIWNRLLRGNEPCLVIGTRASIFLPFAKLGLVVVDEEHDQSYKQFEPAPRLNVRDSAIMLAHMHGAKTLLGSATPSVETYYKSESSEDGLVSLKERYACAPQPQIEIVDMARERKRKTVNGSFANVMVDAVRQVVADGKQAILFNSKRGFAPMARCRQCQFVPKCAYCDVSLTYHKRVDSLICHYCGSVYPLPETCPVCKEPAIEVVGYGTERVEDEAEELFAGSRILRMDLDTTRNKNSYDQIITQFSEHKADILVGTQMVTKGLDFGAVALSGVVNADALINYPDFRSAERAFDLLEQVSGRAGREADTPGRAIIQTSKPDHPVIGFVKEHDFLGFYRYEIEERRAFAYPPFSRLIYINLRHRDERELDETSRVYADRLRALFGTRVHGPAKPPVGRIQNMHIRQVMLKVELNASMAKVKEYLRALHAEMCRDIPAMRQTSLYYDVDPY